MIFISMTFSFAFGFVGISFRQFFAEQFVQNVLLASQHNCTSSSQASVAERPPVEEKTILMQAIGMGSSVQPATFAASWVGQGWIEFDSPTV